MLIVVDANIFVAAFLKASLTRELLLDERLRLITPEYGLTETRRVLQRPNMLKRLGLDSLTFEELWSLLTGYVKAIPQAVYRPALKEALKLAVHPEDAPYLALALTKHCPIWTNDPDFQIEKVKEVVSICTTSALVRLIEKTH